MPNNLTDDPSQYATNIQVPSPGDPRTDTSVATPFQQCANRTANITSRLDAIAAPTKLGYSPALPAGVSMGSVTLVATSVAALQSIPAANRVDGMFGTVKDGFLYQFDIVSTQSAAAPSVVQPSDVIGGAPGRWLVSGYNALNVANGIPLLDGSARLNAGQAHYAPVIEAFVTPASGTTTLAGSITSVMPGSTISLPGVLSGDLIFVEFNGQLLMPASAGISLFGCVNVPGTGDVTLANGGTAVSNGASIVGYYVSFFSAYTAATSGTFAAKIQASVTGGGTVAVYGGVVRARVTRP